MKLLRDQNILLDASKLGDLCLSARNNVSFAEKGWTKTEIDKFTEKTVELMIVSADIAYERMDVAKATSLIEKALALHAALQSGRIIDRLDILFCQVAMYVNLGRRGGTWLFIRWLFEFRKIGRNRWKVFISDSAKRPGLMMMARNFMSGLRLQHDFERHLGIPRGKPRFLAVFEAFLSVVQEEYGAVHPTTLLGMMVVGRELTKTSGQMGINRAEEMLRHAVDGAIVTMGRTRQELVSAMMGLADCYECQGKYQLAVEVYIRAVDACKDVKPTRSPFLCLCGVARCQRMVGDYSAALAALNLAETEALTVFHLPIRHPLLTSLYRSRALTLIKQIENSNSTANNDLNNREAMRQACAMRDSNKPSNIRLQNIVINTMNAILFSFLGAPS